MENQGYNYAILVFAMIIVFFLFCFSVIESQRDDSSILLSFCLKNNYYRQTEPLFNTFDRENFQVKVLLSRHIQEQTNFFSEINSQNK